MGHTSLIAQKERERAALLQQGRDTVEAGEREGRSLSLEQDATVVKLLKQAKTLEQEIQLLQRDRRRAIPSKHTKAEGA